MKADIGRSIFAYVPGIDGLRALAVLSVLVFHLNEALLPRGYVGVDVFFVISGFVVTGSLMGLRFERLRDLMTYFYARRLLRIAPALTVMLLVTTLLATLFISESWLNKSLNHVGASAFFGFSNIILALQTDSYFAPTAAYNPYLHTWSLGVEEQFYLVFPFLMYWHQHRVWKNGSDWLTPAIIAAASIASLALCYALTAGAWRYAFYMMPPRFWELGAGMLLCLTMTQWRARIAEFPAEAAGAAALASAGLIVLPMALPLSGGFPFPWAILTTLGASGAIALVCARRDGALAALLSSPLAVAIGKRSYSIYLWHYPVYVLYRWTVGLEGWITASSATLFVFLLAEASYRFVETPARRSRIVLAMPREQIVVASLAIVALCAGTAVATMKAKPKLLLSRTADHNVWYADELRELPPEHTRCSLIERAGVFEGGSVKTWVPENCRMKPARGRLFVIGDSHALHYIPILRRFAAWHGAEARVYTAPGCAFLGLMEVEAGCADNFAPALAEVRRNLRPDDVVFLPSLRLRRLINQWGPEQTPAISPHKEEEARIAGVAEARAVLTDSGAAGSRFVFEAPTPIFRSPPFRCLDWFNSENPICKPGFVMPAPELERLRAPILSAMRALQGSLPRIEIWDPFPAFCDERVCSALGKEGPFFFDADHLSGLGNDRLYPRFEAFMAPLFGIEAASPQRRQADLGLGPH